MVMLNVLADRPDDVIREALVTVLRAADEEFSPLRFEGEYPTSGYGIGEIRPTQVLSTTTDTWQFQVTTSFNNWINLSISRDAFILSAGVFNLTLDPQCAELFPASNGLQLPYLNIEQIYAHESPVGYFSKPFATSPNNVLQIQAKGRNAGTEKLGLLGNSVARRNFLVTANP